MTRPLIVTAELGSSDFAWLDGLRKAHFPPERNWLNAHLTMFHALPPSSESELVDMLKAQARNRAPEATLCGIMDLGGGVAFRVRSEELDAIRDAIADRMHGLLTAQDSGGWTPHVTVQNKAKREDAVRLRKSLEREFVPRALAIAGLGLHRYMGGPWETVRTFPFRGF